MLNNRKIKLSETLEKKEVKGDKKNKLTILFKPENIFYLTNFWGEGITILSEDGKNSSKTKLLVPKLEYTRAINSSKDCEVISSDRGTAIINELMSLIKDDNIIFSDTNNYDIINKFQSKAGIKNLIIDNNLLYELRQIKDPDEIHNIENASKIIDKLFQIATNEIKENISEEQIQSILVYEAMKLGARFPAYAYTSNPLIVASGNNASFPHAETSNKKITSGELIVIDITLCYNHYVSDATRTFALGNIPQDMEEIYEVVKLSQQKGIEHLKRTSDFSDVDASCRNVIINEKLGDYFTHSTGHGIGLEVHEPPWIRPNFNSKIKENMTITIEPGIYIENKFGVRIEDSLQITKNKRDLNNSLKFDYQNFHSFSKELLVL